MGVLGASLHVNALLLATDFPCLRFIFRCNHVHIKNLINNDNIVLCVAAFLIYAHIAFCKFFLLLLLNKYSLKPLFSSTVVLC